MNKKPSAKFYKPSAILRQKIGGGPLTAEQIARAQSAIDHNDVDFTPLGLQFLEELQGALTHLKGHMSDHKADSQKQSLTEPVMELKANAAMFNYELVGSLANIMLNFLESIEALDKDALDIVQGHHDSLKVILNGKMKGDGGGNGQVMLSELNEACARYYKKRRKTD